MATKLISTTISTQVIKFKPGSLPASFEVTVFNESDQFASFELEVVAAGADPDLDFQWYELSPAVSAKKPPGDSTKFHVTITNNPVPGFIGTMNLTVRVYSMELRDEDRQVLRLIVQEGVGARWLTIDLPKKEFAVYPLEKIEIPVRIKNSGKQPLDVVLSLSGVEYSWLIDGAERRFQLDAGGQKEVHFLCQPPLKAAAELYGFTIEATHRHGIPMQVGGILEVLPTGLIKLSCNPIEQRIPVKKRNGKQYRTNAAGYDLIFENTSNVRQQVSVQVDGKDRQKCNIEVIPETINLNPGETNQLLLVVSKQRHRWGWPQKLLLEVTPILSDRRLEKTDPPSQILKLRVAPLVPFWLQLLGLLLLLLLILILWFRPYEGHTAPVTSVRFNGLADRVISGSDDQTIRSWVAGNRLKSRGVLAPAGKAVRVVRFRPVDNNLVAAGLENGEIQLWDMLSKKRQKTLDFSYQKDDRVFGLEFTKDSRYLFSGHGSGLVLQWVVAPDVLNNLSGNKPRLQKKLDFAIYDLALVGNDDKNLVIGGRYNQLVAWNWTQDKLRRFPYRKGGQDDYLISLDTAENKPNRLVTADNQGYVTLWDMRRCLSEDVSCEILDEWRVLQGTNGSPVRSVALSANGCYLASGGDDGKLKIWPLTPEGKRDLTDAEGIAIAQLSTKLNSVDIRLVEDKILVASGSDDNRVRLYQIQQRNIGCK